MRGFSSQQLSVFLSEFVTVVLVLCEDVLDFHRPVIRSQGCLISSHFHRTLRAISLKSAVVVNPMGQTTAEDREEM